MAKKKSKTQQAQAARQRRDNPPRSARHRQRLVLGGVALLVAIGVAVGMRLSQQRHLPLQLQGTVDNHYVRGAADALVVLKEFSDYT